MLMSVVAGMAAGMVGAMAIYIVYLLTCLVAGVLMYVPVLSNLPMLGMVVLTLPMWVFMRVYSLVFLEQFEERFRIEWITIERGGFPVIVAGTDQAAAGGAAAKGP
jgi:hypothetical protein